jgi:glycosyltransferase involved in cell wall biosynthesis
LYNEQDRVLSVLKKLSSLPQIDKFILVDDGSTDGSKKLIEHYCDEQIDDRIQFISYPENAGKSFAVLIGLQEVQTEYVLLFDADLIHIDTNEVSFMIESIYAYPRIDMGILRRISSERYIKIFYKELILSGQRMIRTQDLKNIFASDTIDRYQLEVAINKYMKQHKKTTVRYPFSAENTYKHHKR